MRKGGRIGRVGWRAESCCEGKLESYGELEMVGWTAVDCCCVAVVVVAAKAYSDRSLYPNNVSISSQTTSDNHLYPSLYIDLNSRSSRAKDTKSPDHSNVILR